MMQNNNTLNTNNNYKNSTSDVSCVTLILDKERGYNIKEQWSKLDKTNKIDKLNKYVDSLMISKNLSMDECDNLKFYLSSSLDRKKLLKVNEVNYNSIDGTIVNIPSLFFNEITRKFTLKKCEKRASTLKSLAPKKKPCSDKKNTCIKDNSIL